MEPGEKCLGSAWGSPTAISRIFLEYFSNISRIFLGLVGLVASFIYSGPVGDNSRLDSMASRWVALLMTTDRKSNLNGRI